MRRRAMRVAMTVLGMVAATEASALVLDSFQSAFPPNPCLPNTGARVIFSGDCCDGLTCPPDPLNACATGDVDVQSGTPGVLLGAPRTAQIAAGLATRAVARIREDLGQLEVAHLDGGGSGNSHFMLLRYGTAAEPLDLDLEALGFVGISMPMSGVFYPTWPVNIVVRLYGDLLDPNAPQARAAVDVFTPGVVAIPASAFVPTNGFTFSDVRQIQIVFKDGCAGIGCTPFYAPARDYTVGPITLDAGATESRRPTWGQLRVRYR